MLDNRKVSVYAIKNKINGLLYIGSTVDIDSRWKLHIKYLRSGTHSDKLQTAWNIFGEESFEFLILEKDIPILDQFVAEQYWLDTTHAYEEGKGYNTHHRAGSFIPLTNETLFERHRKAINNVKDIINDLERKIPYRNLSEKYGVSLGYISNIKSKYLKDMIVDEMIKRKRRKEEKDVKASRREEKNKLRNRIKHDLASGSKYEEILKNYKVSLSTVRSIEKEI